MGAPKLTKLSLWGAASAYNEGRAYRHPVSGKQYPSITTILKLVDKSALIQWSVNLTVDWCVNNVDTLLAKSIEGGKAIARYRHKDVLNERAEVGTGVHEYIECEHTGSWEYPELDAEQTQIIEYWHEFAVDHEIEAILSEFTVSDERVGYMGTADGYWKIKCTHELEKGVDCFGSPIPVGHLCLVDLKTSRNTWPEHYMQLAALDGANEWLIEVSDMVWEAQTPRLVDDVVILHLRADEYDEYGRVSKPGFAKLKPVKNVDLRLAQFVSYANTWHITQEIAKTEKMEELLTSGF